MCVLVKVKWFWKILGQESPAFQEIYVTASNTVEKWTKIMYIVMVYVTPIVGCSAYGLVLLWIHFTRGVEKEDYRLVYPYW